MKVLLRVVHLNGHTLTFYAQQYKLACKVRTTLCGAYHWNQRERIVSEPFMYR